jgi:FAD/FMN-containing dehydrogenase
MASSSAERDLAWRNEPRVQIGRATRTERYAAHDARVARLAAAMRESGAGLRLGKDTTNLFRDRRTAAGHRLDVRDLTQVLDVDRDTRLIDVEGMCPYSKLVDATLPHGLMPSVVPELRSITIGGALAGIGIESSSFRYGLVHETITEFDVLLGDGEIVTCRPDNEHADLYFGFPNTFGTLGYAVRTQVRAHPTRPYVQLAHRRFADIVEFIDALAAAVRSGEADFVEGEFFGPDEMYVSTGRFVEMAPYTSDYSFERIYYQSIRERSEDYLDARAYIWRWDTDWFWCSKATGAQIPLLRRHLFGRERLNSITYMKLLQFSARFSLLARAWGALGYRSEPVIQDVPIPVEQVPAFLAFFTAEIGITPVWCCPVQAHHPGRRFPFFPLEPGKLYLNLGFWDVIRRREVRPTAYYNRLIEAEVKRLGGLKSLYSDVFYTQEEFERIYDVEHYRALKRRYDPNGRLPGVYEKCVLGG